MKTKILRSGDVNFYLVDSLPDNVKQMKSGKSFITARGEATGSLHKVNVNSARNLKVFKDNENNTYVVLLSAGTLTHTHDHNTITIDKGIWKQVQEREIDWFSEGIEKKVID